MRTRVVIQSRLSSSRLPGKALMMVGGMPLLELVARRASRTGFEVVVATSEESYDDRIAQELAGTGIPVVRGPLDDVLARFVMATSDMAEEDTVIRLTGDNPVTDADLIQELMDAVADAGLEYGLYDMGRVPEGLGVEVIPVRLLRRAAREATSRFDREHVTPWIRRNTTELSHEPENNPGFPTIFRVSVDCLHDFTRVARLFDEFADPVAVPWHDLMDSLIGHVRALGPIAREVPSLSPRTTTLMLGVGNLREQGSERNAANTRAVFTRAVEAGVSDVVSSAEDASIIHTGLLPMLRQRMAVSIILPRVAHADVPALYLRYLIERARVDSGHANLRAVFLQASDLASEIGESLLDVVTAYVEAGAVKEIGVALDREISLLPQDVSRAQIVVAPLADQTLIPTLTAWRSAGRTVLATVESSWAEGIFRSWDRDLTHALVVQPGSRRELTSLLSAG